VIDHRLQPAEKPQDLLATLCLHVGIDITVNFKASFFTPVLILLVIACSAKGELPEAHLTSIFPSGAKQGGAVEVTLTGQDLDEISALHFSDPRITAKPVPLGTNSK